PELPEQETFQELVESLLVEWWVWLWEQIGVNGPPLARSDTIDLSKQVAADGEQLLTIPLNVLENDIEPEQEPVTAILRSTTTHGQLTLRPDGTFDYTPDEGFEGVDTFRYIAFDSTNESSEATVRIYVGFRGDYDASGMGDGRDFLVWQRTLGQSATPAGSGADGDGDGVVTLADGSVWSHNFGVAHPETAGETVVRGDGELLQLEASTLTASNDDLLAASVTAAASRIDISSSTQIFETRRSLDGSRSRSVSLKSLGDSLNVNVSSSVSTVLGQRLRPRPATGGWEHAVDRAFDELFKHGLMRLRREFTLF
ncbi:MAG TPA: Ig-like domain-containing protein, partial [Lacipirellula sp.]